MSSHDKRIVIERYLPDNFGVFIDGQDIIGLDYNDLRLIMQTIMLMLK